MPHRPDLDGRHSRHSLEPKEWCFDPSGALWGRSPNGHLFYLNDTWTITGPREAPTVTPSISVSDSTGELWHGFLTAGQWKDA